MPLWFGSIAGSPLPPISDAALPPSASIWWWSLRAPATKANGARLGWLLIPHHRAVEVWPASGDPQRFEGIAVLEAGPEFPALQLQLAEIWAG
jgi:hypothetical protein